MDKKIFLLIIIAFLIIFNLSIIPMAYADGEGSTGAEKTSSGDSTTGGATVSLDNPLGQDVTPQTLIGRVINALLGIIGSVALVMFVYGGITMLTSMGSPEKMGQAKGILVGAILGLIIVFASYALVNFVIGDMIGAK